jgi:hypothetical protein
MKRTLSFLTATMLALLAVQPALAHEHQTFMIGDTMYDFTVGSLNEPVTVDDKTGVDIRVKKLGTMTPGSHDHGTVPGTDGAVTGLEETLKVELIAGDKKKILDLSPAYNDPGAYRAPFYPTVQTTFTYRVFGTIENIPVDLSFTCNPAGHPATPEDKTEVKLGEQVTRTEKRGAFGCPVAKAALGFPEESASIRDIADTTAELQDAQGGFGTPTGVLAVAALVLSVLAFLRGKRRLA